MTESSRPKGSPVDNHAPALPFIAVAMLALILLGGAGIPIGGSHGLSPMSPTRVAMTHAPSAVPTISYYRLSFVETGLPSGTRWTVNLSSGLANASLSNTTRYNNFTEPSGAYAYSAVAVGYLANPGRTLVNGSPTIVTVAFSVPRSVLFSESNLSSGTTWTVNVTGPTGPTTSQSAQGSIRFSEPKGTYTFTVATVGRMVPSPSAGNFTVNVTNLSLSVSFSAIAATYSVTFSETGLPNPANWTVGLGGVYQTAYSIGGRTVPSLSFSEPNGSYTYTALSSGFYAPSPRNGTAKIQGANVSVALTFTRQPTYNVVFRESGLVNGTHWQVDLAGMSNGSTLTSLTIPSVNGTFGWYASSTINSTPVNQSGSVTVGGANQSVPVKFTLPPMYNVTFLERGLPPGKVWGLNLSVPLPGISGPGATSNSSSLRVQLPNGTYSYWIHAGLSYSAQPASGTIVVNAAPLTVNVSFQRNYNLSFVESGLPARSIWTVILRGTWYNSTAPSNASGVLTLHEPNASYSYSVPTQGLYAPTLSNGTVTVQGAAVNVSVRFALQQTYAVSFAETGLPGGNWSVDLAGRTVSGSAATLKFLEGNGSYSYTVPTQGSYQANPASGTVRVRAAPVNVSVKFAWDGNFSVTFTQSGLPSGTNWTVNLSGQAQTGSGSSMRFAEPNGSYAWAASAAVNGSALRVSGNVTVAGKSVSVPVAFQVPAALRTLTFEESGLGSATPWTVTLTGDSSGLVIELGSSVTRGSTGPTAVVFRVSDGNYSFETSAAGYRSVSRSIVIHGVPLTIPVTFVANPSPGRNATALALPGWAAGIGIAFLLVGACGLTLTAYRMRSRQKARGRRLVARIAEAEWARDPNGDPVVRTRP